MTTSATPLVCVPTHREGEGGRELLSPLGVSGSLLLQMVAALVHARHQRHVAHTIGNARPASANGSGRQPGKTYPCISLPLHARLRTSACNRALNQGAHMHAP
jgi:hypothetical protein